ncbi:hypothetical protein M758_UG334600 [Ceratodon purpureus]|nr:hypothetical protein M758_UG334600 [Ceratodon purpureus]
MAASFERPNATGSRTFQHKSQAQSQHRLEERIRTVECPAKSITNLETLLPSVHHNPDFATRNSFTRACAKKLTISGFLHVGGCARSTVGSDNLFSHMSYTGELPHVTLLVDDTLPRG